MDLSSAATEPVTFGQTIFYAVLLVGAGAMAAMLARASARERIGRAGWMRVAAWWAGVAAVWMGAWIILPLAWMMDARSPLAFHIIELLIGIYAASAIVVVAAALACTAVWVAARLAPD